MQANYRNTVKKLSGNTSDIVSVVMETYNKDWQQVGELAKTFRPVDSPVWDVCKNIFDYIINNVRYKEDPAGVQWVKTPARLIADGVGDCKSMSIFSASCLRSLGIDHFFRFVSFNKRKEATHVYVVAVDENGKNIILDPVVRPVQFNKEEKYTYKSDMRGTDIYYLSGIAPRNNGEFSPSLSGEDENSIWFGENPDDYSKHKMNLLSFMDLKLSESAISKTMAQLADCYNELDMLSLAVYACENSRDKEELSNYFRHISAMKLDHAFDNTFTDMDARSHNLATLKTTLRDRLNKKIYFSYDADLYAWLNTNCLVHYEESISGIGSTYRAQEAAKKIKESGIYYIYTFIPTSMESRYPVSVLRKKQKQKEVYQWVDETDGYNSSAIQANLVRSGIISSTGKTPEELLSSRNLKEFRIGGVGSVIAILGVISVLLSIIKLLIDIFGKIRSEPTEEEIKKGLADFEFDLGKNPIPTITEDDQTPGYSRRSNRTLPLAAAGLAALLFFKK